MESTPGEQPGDVVVLDGTNFGQYVNGPKPAFVEFYAPWCGHCKNLAPEWEKLGTTFKDVAGTVTIAKLDADANKDLAGKFGVTGFPTIKWFPANSNTPEDYDGGRTADDLIAFVNTKTGLNKKIKTIPTAVTVLDSANFDAIVSNPTTHKLLEFYAPWCGHCKQLAPLYEKLATAFAGEATVLVAKIDADKHRDLGERFGVKGFPTLKFIPAGPLEGKPEEAAEDYTGGRDLETFTEFLNSKAGTSRASDGSLLASAGRVESLDLLAGAFMMANAGSARGLKIEAAEAVVAELKGVEASYGKVYVSIMKKVVEKGVGYVAAEAGRVGGMLKSSSLSPFKRTELSVKLNVLQAFE
jgi:protein disulfide-isomerase A6